MRTIPYNYGLFKLVSSRVSLCKRAQLTHIEVIILAMIQFLAFFLSRIRQPRVIAEVIGGVLLGPSVMGRIPGFSSSIFPPASLPMINLTSTIGLVLFLFLVGLEIDVRVIRRNAKASMAISAVGLIVPLGLGATLGIPIYHQFVDPSVNYGYFLLFVAVAMGITAFPVLCRILTELKLLEDTVGAVVLAAGVGNDVSLRRQACHRIVLQFCTGCRVDSAGPDRGFGQRRQRTHGALGTSDSSRLHPLPTHSSPLGIPLGRSTDWKLGNRSPYRYNDDDHPCPGILLRFLHRHHWYPRHLW